MICSNCQTQNPEAKKFCRECGKPLDAIKIDSTKTDPKKRNRWWIWLILIGILAVAAYFVFFGGGMGSGIQFNSSKSSPQAGSEKQLVEKLIEAMRNNDVAQFLDNQCLSRADLDELNSFMPEEEKFDIQSMSERFGSIERKLLSGLNYMLTSSQESGMDWSQAKVISVMPEQRGDNPKLLNSLSAVIESNGLQYSIFFEACAKFKTGWKVCKEIEWNGLIKTSDSGNQSPAENMAVPGQIETLETQEPQASISKVQVEEVWVAPIENQTEVADQNTQVNPTEKVSDDGYKLFAAENGDTFLYKGETKDGQAHGVGRASLSDESIYEGEFQNNLFHGDGTQTFKNGVKYTGSFRNGLRNGKGTYTWADGSTYVGEYLNGQRHGKGTFIWQDGQRYEGDFYADYRTGFGTYYWPGGATFTGTFEQNKRIKGLLTYDNGATYEGEFQKDLKHGFGVYTWTNGVVYKGDFFNDVKEGFGIITWADGSKYEGNWSTDNRNGLGTFWWPDGSYWKGSFGDNFFNGQGVDYYANGSIRAQGIWSKGVFQKQD